MIAGDCEETSGKAAVGSGNQGAAFGSPRLLSAASSLQPEVLRLAACGCWQ
jgi:hypothetical protein